MVSMDAGYVSQNIDLFCAAAGLATVPRATMDIAAIKNLLKLNENQVPLLNNPVGYPKE
jgi:nitroreductase